MSHRVKSDKQSSLKETTCSQIDLLVKIFAWQVLACSSTGRRETSWFSGGVCA